MLLDDVYDKYYQMKFITDVARWCL